MPPTSWVECLISCRWALFEPIYLCLSLYPLLRFPADRSPICLPVCIFIIFRMHERNGLKFGMMHHGHLQNGSNFSQALLLFLILTHVALYKKRFPTVISCECLGRNGTKFGVMVYLEHLQNWLDFAYVLGPHLLTWINFNPSMDSYIHYNVWHQITYLFTNLIDATVEVWELISHFISHFTGHVITYPCWD